MCDAFEKFVFLSLEVECLLILNKSTGHEKQRYCNYHVNDISNSFLFLNCIRACAKCCSFEVYSLLLLFLLDKVL